MFVIMYAELAKVFLWVWMHIDHTEYVHVFQIHGVHCKWLCMHIGGEKIAYVLVNQNFSQLWAELRLMLRAIA